EDIEDAALVPSVNGASLPVQVTLAEPLGAEGIAHFPLGAAAGARQLVTARLSPRSGARSGKPLRVAIDLERLYFFDPESQQAIGCRAGAQCPAAPVAQWIEQRFPKPRAHVRFMPGASQK